MVMNNVMRAIGAGGVGHFFLWALLSAATMTATLMITVGMLEELPGIIRDVWNRSFTRR
jgi:hypothetical protein